MRALMVMVVLLFGAFPVMSTLATLNSHSHLYNQLGQRTVATHSTASPTKWEYTYDPLGQLKSALPYGANSTLITAQRIAYGYDAAGNLNYRTNDLAVRQFIDDKINQLTNVALLSPLTVSGVTTTNATNVTVNGITATLNVDGTYAATVPIGGGTNAVTAIGFERFGRRATNTVSVTGSAPQYDANGNMLFDGKRGFAYDDENQLTNIVVTNQWKSEFVYDGFGRRRIRKEFTWNGAWSLTNEVRYIYDGLLAIQERDSSNVVTVTYTRGTDFSGGMQGGGGIGGLLARNAGGTDAFYQADGNGNITALIDLSQNVVARYAYDAFGNVLSMSGSLASANPYRFSTKETHANSGLLYFGYRYYNAGFQRWINRDPIGEAGGLNLYQFVGNDVLNAIDPFGWDYRYVKGSIIGERVYNNLEYTTGDTFTEITVSTINNVGRFVLNLSFDHLDKSLDLIRGANEFVQSVERATGHEGLSEFLPMYAAEVSFVRSMARCPAVIPAAKTISTGRTVPNSLTEKLAMEQVMAKPMGTTPPRMPPMSDTKNNLLAAGGWVKRAQNVNGVEIHYVENIRTGQVLDFKFKD